MPIYLTETDVAPRLDGCASVLIVPCRFCPAASFAVRTDEPYLDFPRRLFRTEAYERYIQKMRSGLEARGMRVGVFRSRLLHQFVLCMWTRRRRQRLAERARDYDAVVVLGCTAAVRTVRDLLAGSACRVVSGMTSEGVMSITPSFTATGTVGLDLESISSVCEEEPAPASDAQSVASPV